MRLNTKNKLLIALVPVALLVCYWLAFSRTIDYRKRSSELEELMEVQENQPEILLQLTRREQEIEAAFEQNPDRSFQNELLRQLNQFAQKHSVKVAEFREPHINHADDIKTLTYHLVLEGGVQEILLVVNAIENNPFLGRVVHTRFIKKTDYRTQKESLEAEIMLRRHETSN